MSSVVPLPNIPPEVMINDIFPKLDQFSLGKCTRVSKEWAILASDDTLWKRLFPRLTHPDLGFPETGVKNFLYEKFLIDNHVIWSTEELFKRIQEFANKIRIDQTGRFHCRLSYTYSPGGCVFLGYSNGKHIQNMTFDEIREKIYRGEPDLVEDWVFMNEIDPDQDTDKVSTSSGNDNELFRFFGWINFPGIKLNDIQFISKIDRPIIERLNFLQGIVRAEQDRKDRKVGNSLLFISAVSLVVVFLGISLHYLTQQSESNVD